MAWFNPLLEPSALPSPSYPIEPETKYLRLTILDSHDKNAARDVTVSELVQSLTDDGDDNPRSAAPSKSGFHIGRRPAGNTPQAFTSRVLSRSHAQFVVDVNGFVFVHDLESMHGTYIQGSPGVLPVTVPSGRALQVLEGDVLIFGKPISMRGEHHQPLRIKLNFCFPGAGKLEDGRTRRTETTFATLEDICLIDSNLNPSPAAQSQPRRFSYGIPESLLYESDADEDLPRGTPTDDMGDPINDDIVVVDDDDEAEVISAPRPVIVVDVVDQVVVIDNDDDASDNIEADEIEPARGLTALVSAPTIDLAAVFGDDGDSEHDHSSSDSEHGHNEEDHDASDHGDEDHSEEDHGEGEHDSGDPWRHGRTDAQSPQPQFTPASPALSPVPAYSPAPYILREPSVDLDPVQPSQASAADPFSQAAGQVARAAAAIAFDRFLADLERNDAEDSSDAESNPSNARRTRASEIDIEVEGPLDLDFDIQHPVFCHSDDEDHEDEDHEEEDEDSDGHIFECDCTECYPIWSSESEAEASDGEEEEDDHDSESESMSEGEDVNADEHDVVATPNTQDKSVGVSSYHTGTALPSPPLSAGDESPVVQVKPLESEAMSTPTVTRAAGLLTPPSTRKRTFAAMEDAEVDATGAAPAIEVTAAALETPSKPGPVKAATPAPVADAPAPERRIKRQRGLASDIGLVAFGVALGAVGTIAGLLQLAGE
ncbi:hypothetical protein Q8F55_005794 [Vanrija albida]|uniref:FHA domain-containing protein n=1 Tax=Vanrija albida TaxID=181172 RepID=A0ABR3Q369_9TREE